MVDSALRDLQSLRNRMLIVDDCGKAVACDYLVLILYCAADSAIDAVLGPNDRGHHDENARFYIEILAKR